MREERPQLVASRPGLKIGEVTKVLAARWNKLAGEKEKFIELADEDKNRSGGDEGLGSKTAW